jgi:hypothetical protein
VGVEFHDPRLAVIAYPGHTESRRFKRRPVAGVEPVVAEVVLDSLGRVVQRRGPRLGEDVDALCLSRQRAGQLRDDQRITVGARLSMLSLHDAQHVPCVLDQYVLEATSGTDERDVPLSGEADGSKRAVHALVRAYRRDPKP